MTREDIVPAGLLAYGALQLLQGAWMVLDPGSFFDAVGPFGTRNDHYIRDAATWSLALGVICIVVARRDRRAAAAVLLFSGLQAALHTVNHIADAGLADPAWVGVVDTVLLGAIAVALLGARRLTTRSEPTP